MWISAQEEEESTALERVGIIIISDKNKPIIPYIIMLCEIIFKNNFIFWKSHTKGHINLIFLILRGKYHPSLFEPL